MKNTRIAKFLSLLILGSLLLSACSKSQQPPLPPDEMVQAGMKKLAEIKSADMALNVVGKTGMKDKGQDFGVNANIKGSYDNAEKENPKFKMSLDAKVQMPEKKEETLGGEMSFVDKSFYFNVTKLSDFGGQVPVAMVEPFLNKWWSIQLPEEYMANFNFYSGDEASMTPEEKKVKELFENTKFFKDLSYQGTEEVNGEDAYKYSGTLDNEALVKYFEESYKLAGTGQYDDPAMMEKDLAVFKDVWGKLQYQGDIWIGAKDQTFRKAAGKAKIDDINGAFMEFDFTYNVDNLNGKVDIVAPQDATVFDPLAFLGASMGGGLEGEAETVPLDVVAP